MGAGRRKLDGLGHHDPRREIQGAGAAAGSMRQPIGNTNWQGLMT
jgi:hypothetical protein